MTTTIVFGSIAVADNPFPMCKEMCPHMVTFAYQTNPELTQIYVSKVHNPLTHTRLFCSMCTAVIVQYVDFDTYVNHAS